MLTSYALLRVCRQQGQVFAELMCKVHENGGNSTTQAFFLEMPIYLPLTLLQAVLETPWNEPSRKKDWVRKYEVTHAGTSDVQAAGLFERERNMGECTRMEVANCS